MAELYEPPAQEECGEAPLRIEAVGMEALGLLRRLNVAVFEETHIINTFDHADLVMLVAYLGEEPAGYKIGYGKPRSVFYSAKGGVLPAFRRRGIARRLLQALMREARQRGYQRFSYDTFPNKHPGMAVMGLSEGFRLTRAGYNAHQGDYRLRLEKAL